MDKTFPTNITPFSLIKFTLPTMGMLVFLAFYTMVDGFFVSNYISTDALSALNIVFPITCVLMAIGIMFAMGGSAVVATAMGGGKEKEARSSFSLVVYTAISLSLLLTVISVVFLEPIVRFLGANDAIFAYCKDYAFVICAFLSMVVLHMMFQYLFVTAGKPSIGLVTRIIGVWLNLILVFFFFDFSLFSFLL